MSEEMAELKYPSGNRPPIILTNDTGTVNLAINHMDSSTANDQIKDYHKLFKKTFNDTYPSATWYTEKVEEFNGKNISIIEILTPATDTKIYNLIVSMELEGRLLTCSFNCTENEMKDWKTIAKTIMNSIELSK
jgi:hypothetical protein